MIIESLHMPTQKYKPRAILVYKWVRLELKLILKAQRPKVQHKTYIHPGFLLNDGCPKSSHFSTLDLHANSSSLQAELLLKTETWHLQARGIICV